MATEMTLFGKPSSGAMALLAGLEDNLTNLLAGSGGSRRISIENNVFREIIGGKEVRVSEDRALKIVIVNASPVSRTYYGEKYVPGQKSKPRCWSSDTQTPAEEVPEEQRQARFCKDCPQNIKGSGSNGEGRACRYSQRVAAVLVNEDGVDDKVYQISMPATSVFGDAEGQKMPLQAYGRYLKAHNTHVISVVTEMRFDSAGQMKLVFKPIRPLTEDELNTVIPLREHPDTLRAITMTVGHMDTEDDAEVAAPSLPDAEAPVKKTVAKPAPEPKAEEEEVQEPKKVVKKTTAPVEAPKTDLADIVGEWDD